MDYYNATYELHPVPRPSSPPIITMVIFVWAGSRYALIVRETA